MSDLQLPVSLPVEQPHTGSPALLHRLVPGALALGADAGGQLVPLVLLLLVLPGGELVQLVVLARRRLLDVAVELELGAGEDDVTLAVHHVVSPVPGGGEGGEGSRDNHAERTNRNVGTLAH